jgi:hypothetical protein
MLRFCLDIVLQMCSLSPVRRELFLKSTSLGKGAVLDHGVFASAKMYFTLSFT